ncbi:MAG: hypothetical protein ACE5EY_16975 [Anaerolineae bacterium]
MTWNLKANWTLFALLACLIVAGVIYGLAITPFVGDGYDDAHYITLAQSLAQGKGYRHLAAPGAPPEVKYPPGWPMLLALVWWLFPDFPANAVWFKAVSAMFAIGFATVMYGWLRWRNEAAVKSLFIALLTLFSPHLLGLGTTAFSEMAFGFFSLLALWLVAVWMKRPTPHIGRTILTALVVAFTLYLRMFGLALITAVLFYVWYKRRNRDALILTLLIIGLILPLLSRLLPSSPYLNEFTLKSMEHATLGRASIIDFLLRILNNLRAYLLAGIPGAVLPSQVPLTYVNMPAALHLGRPWPGVDILLSVMVSGGVIGQILLRRSLSDWYVAFYLGMALLWPWEPTRFMVPLIPLMIEYFWFEVSILGQVLLGKRRQWRHRQPFRPVGHRGQRWGYHSDLRWDGADRRSDHHRRRGWSDPR